jgi:Ca2+-binding RTX toxin-like protein
MTQGSKPLYVATVNIGYKSNIAVNSDIVITFTDPIVAGSGYIKITNNKGEVVLYENILSPNITITGNTLTLNPSKDFDFISDYRIVAVGAIVKTKDGIAFSTDGAESTIATFQTEISNSPITFVGTSASETIHGSKQADTLNGAGGSDTIYGYAGNDIINGDDPSETSTYADDYLRGNEGNDTIHGYAGRDQIYGDEGNDVLYGDAGNDNLSGGTGDDILYGGDGNDNLYDEGGKNILNGDDGDDSLSSRVDFTVGQFSQLFGGAGNDQISAVGSDQVFGGTGNDSIAFQPYINKLEPAKIDAGPGDDKISLALNEHKNTINITTGEGSDTIAMGYVYQVPNDMQYTVLDFTPGAGGDKIDVGSLIYSPTPNGKNPFANSEQLRLVKVGSDTQLQFKDSSADISSFRILLTLKGISPDQLTVANFVDGINPDGSQTGLTINGTNSADKLTGGRLNDRISGFSGPDVIIGGSGDDTLIGGDVNSTQDDDTLYGGMGNDLLIGGPGNDNLNGEDGDDTLEGGDGDDVLRDSTGLNTLRGQNGNDQFYIYGNGSNETSSAKLEGGNGDDVFRLEGYNKIKNVEISGGPGSDTIWLVTSDVSDIKVLDFSTAEGDKLNLKPLIYNSSIGNPFGSAGYLKATQEGSDVIIQYDQDGAKGGLYGFRPLIKLENFNISNLTSASFVDAWNPNGSDNGLTIRGTVSNDTLSGSPLNDEIYGDSGDDNIRGDVGDDTLYGDAGNDYLMGDYGNDAINGGAGNDTLDGGYGNDILEGGEGDDRLTDYNGVDTLRGGDGNDNISLQSSGGSVDGGDGNDNIYVSPVASKVDAGNGDDMVYLSFQYANTDVTTPAIINLGDGNDRLTFNSSVSKGDASVTGGNGQDTYAFTNESLAGHLIINDFKSGANGDVLSLETLLSTYSYDGGNPFGPVGLLKIEQNGNDTIITYDQDGVAGSKYNAYPLITLKNLKANTLTMANFTAGINPNGSDEGLTIYGDAKNLSLKGDFLNDRLYAGKIGSTLMGGRGNDELYGGKGDDQLNGESGNDILMGGLGDDRLFDALGDNKLYGGEGNDYLSSMSTGTNLLEGGNGNDNLSAGNGNDTLIGGAGNDRLTIILPSESSSNITKVYQIRGDAGQDNINLSYSYNVETAATINVYGGTGIDTFSVSVVAPKAPFIIHDFETGANGDYLDITQVVNYLSRETNPFGKAAYARAVQRGTDTVIQIDSDGPDGFKQFVDVFVLKNISLNALTPANFVNYYSIDGVARGIDRAGGEENDQLVGTKFNDKLTGNAGNDKIDGGEGNDELIGGAGNDTLNDSYGENVFYGGDGDDIISSYGAAFNRGAGGAGNDTFNLYGMSGFFSGDEGNDVFWVKDINPSGARSTLSVNGGDGDDFVSIAMVSGDSKYLNVSGGNGADTFEPTVPSPNAKVFIQGFEATPNGDKISLTELLRDLNVTAKNIKNPFTDGYLKFQQNDKDTLLIFDRDGKGPELGQTVLTLTGTDANQITRDNISGAYDPKGGIEGFTRTGGSGADKLSGSWTVDTINGGAGNDTIDGDAGNDILNGEDGDDNFIAGVGDDKIDGGNGVDTVIFKEKFKDYEITKTTNGFTVKYKYFTSSEGSDSITNVEHLKFADLDLNLTVKNKSSKIDPSDLKTLIELYIAFFNRTPDADGMSYWIDQVNAGKSISMIADAFYTIGASDQFKALTGFSTTMSNEDFINTFYRNVLGRDQGADEGGLAYWNSMLSNGSSTRSTLAKDILTAAHTFKGNAEFGWVADLLDNKVAVGKTIAVDWGINMTNNAYERGVEIANAVTTTDTSYAIRLVGFLTAEDFQFI